MTWTLVVPAGLAVAAGLLAARLQHRVEPAVAAAGLTTAAVVAVAGVAGALAMVAVVFLGRLAWLADGVAWCLAVGADHRVPTAAGGVALAVLGAMTTSAARRARRLRATSAEGAGEPVVILPTARPTAFAVPGRPGHVVVSQGMLRSLDRDERRALLAHERAHLRRSHHRYVWACEVAASALPLLRPLRRAVRLSTERWADEDAAAEVGDRRLVARAICRAALVQHEREPVGRLAMAARDVPRRVEALLEHPARPRRTVVLLTVVAMVALASASSSLQLHHLAAVVTHVCAL